MIFTNIKWLIELVTWRYGTQKITNTKTIMIIGASHIIIITFLTICSPIKAATVTTTIRQRAEHRNVEIIDLI